MERVHNAVAWYQKKIGSYDKQLWEQSVEQKVLVKGLRHAPRKSGRVKTELIDVDLVKGSTFTKAKPQLPWIVITKMTFVRVMFFPLYYKWWKQQTCRSFCIGMFVLYMLQILSICVFLKHWNIFLSKPNISVINLVVPCIMMSLLGMIHSQTVLSHVTHKPPVPDSKLKSRLKRVKKNISHKSTSQSNGSVIKPKTRLVDVEESNNQSNHDSGVNEPMIESLKARTDEMLISEGSIDRSQTPGSEKESDVQSDDENGPELCVENKPGARKFEISVEEYTGKNRDEYLPFIGPIQVKYKCPVMHSVVNPEVLNLSVELDGEVKNEMEGEIPNILENGGISSDNVIANGCGEDVICNSDVVTQNDEYLDRVRTYVHFRPIKPETLLLNKNLISCSDTDTSHYTENYPPHENNSPVENLLNHDDESKITTKSSLNAYSYEPNKIPSFSILKSRPKQSSFSSTNVRRRKSSLNLDTQPQESSSFTFGTGRSKRLVSRTVRIQSVNRDVDSSTEGDSESPSNGVVFDKPQHTGMSSEEYEDRMQSDVANSSSTTSCIDTETDLNDPDKCPPDDSLTSDPSSWSASMTHVINLLQPSTSTSHVVMGQPDRVSCMIWEGNECKKVDLTALDIGWAIIEKVDKIPESSDYILIGTCCSVIMAFVPLLYKLYLSSGTTIDFPKYLIVLSNALSFSSENWMFTVININGTIQRFCLGLSFFFLLSVADRTFKQRLLYAKHFCYLTSSRRSRKYDMPHFRLNKVCNIKAWLSLRSYLKKRGPQRSVDVIVSSAFVLSVIILTLMGFQLLKDSDKFLDNLINWDLFVWCIALSLYILRYMTLGLKINKKYRNLSVLITEQINLYLQMEQKPHKKERKKERRFTINQIASPL